MLEAITAEVVGTDVRCTAVTVCVTCGCVILQHHTYGTEYSHVVLSQWRTPSPTYSHSLSKSNRRTGRLQAVPGKATTR